MSASNKKQQRREAAQASLSQKQDAAKKEAKQTKLYTAIFAAVIAVMLVVVVAVSIGNSGIIERHTTAAQVGDTKISATEFNYYYMDAVNGFMNQYGQSVGLMGIDPLKPLDEQTSIFSEDQTWADYFMDIAKDNLHATYALYNESVANGFALGEEETAALDKNISDLKAVAKTQNMSVSKYLTALFGFKSSLKDFRHYNEVQVTASAYLNSVQEAQEFSDEQIQAKDDENPLNYNSYSFNLYTLNTKDFLKGGTKDEDGKVTYSDEEIEASVKAAEKAAKELASGKYETLADFDKAVAALEINKDKKEIASISNDNSLYRNIPVALQEWISDSSRKEGDIASFAKTMTDADDKTVTNGFYVPYFKSSNDNSFALRNVRHILIPFLGGHPSADGTTLEYTEEEKAVSKSKAEEVLKKWQDGEATEDSFAALVPDYSTDPGSSKNGGLYTDIFPGQMVPSFNDWTFDDARKAGDTGIVESNYGFHVMYFSGLSDTSYRSHLIESDLFSETMDTWYQGVMDARTLDVLTDKYAPTDLVLGTRSMA